MNVDMKEQVVKLLEGYSERERQIALLHYEMQHTASISPEEVIGSMSLGHNDDIGGGSSRGHISNKTAYIALNYQERMDHLKTESLTEIAERLMKLEAVQDRIRYYVSLLEKRESETLRLGFIEGRSWEEVALKNGVSLRTIHNVKNRAIDHLTELYAYKADLA